MIRCGICGRFLASVVAQLDCFRGSVLRVEGDCRRHGRVEAARGWSYDELFPEGSPDPCEEASA